MCVVNAPSTLTLTTISFSWWRYRVVDQFGLSNERVFISLPLSDDNVGYTCQYRASSVYLNNIVDVFSPRHTIGITSRCIDMVCYGMLASE